MCKLLGLSVLLASTSVMAGNTWPEHSGTMHAVSIGGGGGVISANSPLCFGAPCSYWFIYNSTSTQFELWTTNSDGAGTDGLALTIDDANLTSILSSLSFSNNPTVASAADTISCGKDGCYGGTAFSQVDAGPTRLWGRNNYPADNGTGATGDLSLSSGMNARRIVMTAASCAGDVVTAIIGTTTVTCTEDGTGNPNKFDCTGETNAACATNLAACMDSQTGITSCAGAGCTSFVGVAGTVYVWLAPQESLNPALGNVTISVAVAGVPTYICANTNSQVSSTNGTIRFGGGSVLIQPGNVPRATAEATAYRNVARTITLEEASTIANWREVRVVAPTFNGVAGGGAETVSSAASLYVDAAPTCTGVTCTNGPYALWVDAGTTRLDGNVDDQGGITIGSGAAILKHLSGTASLNFGATGGGSCDDLTIAVTSAVDGNTVNIGVPVALANSDATSSFSGFVSAAGTVTIRRCCYLAIACSDPPAATVRADVWQH